MKRPKLIIILLAGGFLLLIAGGAIAASLPSWPSHKATLTAGSSVRQAPSASAAPLSAASPLPSPTPSATASAHAPAAKPAASREPKQAKDLKDPKEKATPDKAAPAKKPRAAQTLTYVVKPGDTLSGIAGWFKLHGYTGLYDWNKSVIGADPDLIFPGQRITVSDSGVMTLSSDHS